MKISMTLGIVLLTSLLQAGCKKDEPDRPKTKPPRPVSAVELSVQQPLSNLKVTGSIRSWKEQDIAFEVAGTVSLIVEGGTNLNGRWVEDGEIRITGDLLARIDPMSYKIRRETANANLAVARKKLKAARIQYEKVLPANIRSAEADRNRALAEHSRNQEAFERNAVSELEVIRTAAARDATAATVEETIAAREAQAAEIEALDANVKQSEEQLRAAQYDLDRCQVFAPFAGEVSRVFVEAGGFVQTGQAVAHLVMMDPIEIDIALSQEMADSISMNQSLLIRVPGEEDLFPGAVYEKATVIDSATRTLRISLITRNRRVIGSLDPDQQLDRHPRIRQHMFLMKVRHEDPDSPYFVEARRALRQEADGSYYVWADPRYTMGDPLPDPLVLTVKKYPVVPGNELVNFQGLYLFRVLDSTEDLPPNSLLPLDIPEGTVDGAQVIVARESWRLRPGQVVEVLLTDDPPPKGFYLPMNAILPASGDEGEIFIARENRAKKIRVALLNNVNELFRVEPIHAEDRDLLRVGAQVLLEPIHFLQNDDLIRIVDIVEQDL